MNLRGKPSLGMAMSIFVVYLVLVYGVWAINDLDYAALDETSESIRDNYALAMVVGAIFLIISITALGWWRVLLFEPKRVGPSWLWVVVGILVVGSVMNLAEVDWSEIAGMTLVWLLIGSIGVGFNEEITTRGLVLVGARSRFQREIWAVLVSCLMFGALHLPNALYGAGIGATVGQFFFASLVGVVFYVLRRFTGTLLVPMVLHGSWDGALFSLGFSGAERPAAPTLMYYAAMLMCLVGLWQILRSDPRTESQPETTPVTT